MLRNLAWHAIDDLTRAQLVMFIVLGDKVGHSDGDRSQALGLSGEAWNAWKGFVIDGPLPPEPTVTEMILRISQASFAASVMDELRMHVRSKRAD